MRWCRRLLLYTALSLAPMGLLAEAALAQALPLARATASYFGRGVSTYEPPPRFGRIYEGRTPGSPLGPVTISSKSDYDQLGAGEKSVIAALVAPKRYRHPGVDDWTLYSMYFSSEGLAKSIFTTNNDQLVALSKLVGSATRSGSELGGFASKRPLFPILTEDVEALCSSQNTAESDRRLRQALMHNVGSISVRIDDKEDIVQTVLLKIWSNCKSILSEAVLNVGAFVRTMIKNEAITSYRKSNLVPFGPDADEIESCASKDNVEKAFEAKDELVKILHTLTKRESEVAWYYAIGNTACETAEKLSIGVNRVREIQKQISEKLARYKANSIALTEVVR